MARQLSLLGSCLLLVFTGTLWRGSAALVLPTRATASPRATNTDEPFTTKRNANLYFDLSKVTRLPLPVVNAEIKSTVLTTTAATESIITTSKPSPTWVTAKSEPSKPSSRGSEEQPLYRLNGSDGQACILLQVDSIITVKYKTTLGEEQEADFYIPSGAKVTGNCDNDNFAIMSLKWDAFVLSWSFAKTPGNEKWYVDKIELTYNSSDRHFEHIDQPNRTIRLSTAQKKSSMLFPTPVGKSYSCSKEQEIYLTDGKNHASILLRDMKLQPFKFKNNDFAIEFPCSALSAQAGRDETAPVAVGSALAAAVLLTISGYAGWRYFKVKKVKYDTME